MGTVFPSHHDVQVGVSGEVAARLGDLVRQRWLAVTGKRIRVPKTRHDPWPPSLSPDVSDVSVGIARTEPQYPGGKGTRKIETLFLDSIAAAQRSIYIENQYLSSAVIGDALVKRLRDPDGPEVVAVITKASAGWLEGATMDVLRSRLVKRLREADKYRRLRIFCPVIDAQKSCCMSIHSKLLIADNQFVRIGSANVSNRSMGFDTECDLVPFREFVVGTFLGMSPGVIGITFFENQVEELLRDPNPISFFVLAVALCFMLLAVYGFRRWFAAKQPPGRRRVSRPSQWAEIR